MVKSNPIEVVEPFHLKLLKSILDTFIQGTKFEHQTQSIIELLHQNDCLKHCLNDPCTNSSSLQITRNKWLDSVINLVKTENSQIFGLSLLCETIRVCDYSTLSVKVDLWLNTITGTIEKIHKKASSNSALNIAIETLTLLVEKACKFNDTKRSITSNNLLSSLVSCLLNCFNEDLKHQVQSKINALSGLIVFIESITTGLKPYIHKIETICYPLLYSSVDSLQESASRVISKLPLCVGINSTDYFWDVVIQKLILESNVILDQLYHGLEDEEQDKKNKLNRTIQLPNSNKLINVGEEQIMNMLKQTSTIQASTESHIHTGNSIIPYLTSGFKGCIEALCKILSSSTIVPCPVPLQDIIELACRALNVSSQNQKKFSQTEFSFSQIQAFTNQIHVQTLILLSNTLKIFRKSLLPHIKTISDLIIRLIKQQQDSPQINLKAQLYQTILDSIESFGTACNQSIASPLVPYLLKDIKPYIPDESKMKVTAIVPNKQNNGVSSNKSLNQISTLDSSDPTSIKDTTSLTSKILSLQVLSKVLLYCGNQLINNQGQNSNTTSMIRLEIDQLLIRLNFESQSLTAKKSSPTYINSSYNSWKYRYYLHEALLNSLLKPLSDLPPVLPYALRVFTHSMNCDLNSKIRALSCQAISICQLLIHPSNPSLLNPSSNLLSLNNILNSNNNNNSNLFGQVNSNNDDDIEMDNNDNEEVDDEMEEEEEEEEQVKSTKITNSILSNNTFQFKSQNSTSNGLKSNLFTEINFNQNSKDTKNNNVVSKPIDNNEDNEDDQDDEDDDELPDIID